MKVSVFGVGKLGASVAQVLDQAGHDVVGVDPLVESFDDVPEPGLRAGNIVITKNATQAVKSTDISLICVPTPSQGDGSYDVRYVTRAVLDMIDGIAAKETRHTVVLMSTVLPGDTERAVVNVLARRLPREAFAVAYHPAFIALGSVVHDFTHPELVLVGANDEAAAASVRSLYAPMRALSKMRVMSIESAEVAKIALNSFVTLKMTFANFLGELCESFPRADARDVVNAIGMDPRVGRAALTPAVGYGGPCFPRDNRAIAEAARRAGTTAPFAHATDVFNNHYTSRIVDLVPSDATKVAIFGTAYKPGTPITEESPTRVLTQSLLMRGGVAVQTTDPLAPCDVDDPQALAAWCDTAVVMTDEPAWGSITWPEHVRVVDPWRVIDARRARVRVVGRRAPESPQTGVAAT